MRKAMVLALCVLLAWSYSALGAVELYGTFECMGVIADTPAGYTAADIGQVRVYLSEGSAWKRVQDAAQVATEEYFASSLFGLSPGTSYTVKVEFYNTSAALIDTEFASGTTRPEISIPTATTSLYVAPGGNDGGAGTLGDPFATLAHAVSVATAGTTVYLRGGTYYEGEVYPTVSGTSAAPIVIRAYASETPVLDGANPGLISTSWTTVQPQVFSNPLAAECWNLCLVRKSDNVVFRAYPMATAAEVTSQTSAGYTFAELNIDAAYCADGSTLTLRVPAGDISDYDVYVSRFETGIYLEGRDFIYIDGVTLTHYGSGIYGRGIYITSSSDILVQRCRFLYNNSGIMIKNASSRDVIQDNYCLDDVADWHFTYAKSLALTYSNEIETGLVVMTGTYSGRGLVIRRNDINGTFDGSEINPYTTFTGRTAETDFYGNTMHHIFDDFLELDGYSRNVRVFDNDMHQALCGISLAQALDGPTWIVRNRIIDCGMSAAGKNPADTLWEGYPFKTNGGPHPEIGSGPAFFYHNTAYTTDPVGYAMLVKSNILWKKFTFRNNIWVGQVSGFVHWSGALSPWDWNYDDLYMYSGPCMDISGTTYNTLADAQAGTGYLLNGISAEPQFVDAATGDFRLAAASPCIDSGVLLPGIDDSFSGTAPDMGAFEADDTDADGLSDAWEMGHFGNLSQGPAGDPDGDGYINLAEYNNGTDPSVAETQAPYLSTIKWEPVGPGGGGAQYNPGIAPNNPDLMYGFCDMGGIYRSLNGGRDWDMYRADEIQFPVAYSPTHCNPAFHPTNGNICFAGVYDGLKRTTDGGDTWEWVATYASPTAVTLDQADPTVVFHATNANRMYKSTDSGSTWAELGSWYSAVNKTVLDIFVDTSTPVSNLTIYAATATGLYKSTDGGTTWAAANGNLPSTGISDFNAGMKAGSAVLYVTLTTPGVYKSTDGGVTWTSASNGVTLGSAGHMELGICDTNADVLYVGTQENAGPTIYKTVDGGANWTMVLTDPSAGNFPAGVTVERDWMTLSLGWGWGEEAHEIGVCATDPDHVAFAEDGRTWASHDGGQSWFCCNSRETAPNSNWWPSRGFEVTTNYSVKFAPWDHNRAYINYTDMGFFRSEDRAYSWRHAISGSPYRNTFYDCVFDPTIPGKMWAVSSNNHDMPHDKMLRQASFLTFTGAVLRSTDYGVSWTTVVYPRGVNGGCTTSLAIDPTSAEGNRTLYVTVSGYGVYKSTDDGATWASASTGLTMPNNNNSWLIKRMSDGTLYCALTASYVSGTRYPGGLFKSTDGAATWTQINASQTLPYIYGFDVDPADQNIIYVATYQLNYDGRQGIYKTTNGGTTWTRTLALADMTDASIDPQMRSRVYATIGQGEDFWSDGGVYLSEDFGTTWTKLTTFPFERYGPSWVSYDPDDSEIVYMTTFGGGAWRARVLHATAPGAAFASSSGPGPLQVTFDSSASTGSVNTYYWQFGDGQVSFEANPVHAYAAPGTFTVTLNVQGPNGTSVISHDVMASDAVVVTTASLPGGAVAGAYSQTLAASGGTIPYSWATSAGTLPDGLSLNASTGEISGTCTAAGTFDFTVQVTDSTLPTPQTATQALQIVVAASNPSITTASLPGGTDGGAYSQTLAATGGITPYTWSIAGGTLPTGLSLNAGTGAISGTAFAAGTFNFTVQVADSQLPAATDSKALSIVIAASDADADGLPDGWEIQHFGDLSQGPNGDPDGDGWTNLQEYNGGSDPNVADAVPPIGMLRAHPRLWMEAGSVDPVVVDSAAVITRTTAPAYAAIWAAVSGSSNVANQALTYLVNGDAAKLSAVKTALSTTTTNAEQVIYRSLAFDWAYAGFTPADRTTYAANLVTSADSIIDSNTYLYGNYGIRYQAAAAMAAMAAAGDADVSVLWPKAYDRMNTVLQITGDGIAPSDMEGRCAYGGGWAEGYDYNRHTQIHMLQYLQGLRSAFGSHEDKLSASAWVQGVVKYMIYGILPDGNYMLPYADNDWPFLIAHDRTIVLLATDAANSPHGQYWLNHVYGTDSYWAYTDLLFYDAARAEQSFDTLPKGAYFPGIGLTIFRSGWGTNDTYVAFKSSDYHTYHQSNAQNAFYIYKSAPLAVRTGVYDGDVHDHNVNYLIRTIAQNCITVFDPTETFSYPDGVPDDNDGGQLVQEWTGEHHDFTEWRAQADRVGTPRNTVDWVDYQLGANYGYAAAEAGRAYKAGKVPFASRQLLWIDPDYIVVFDRVTSGDANHQKKFQLHSPEGMTLAGDTAIIETTTAPGTTAPARLFCKNLLPSGVSMALVGGVGNEFFYNGRNHPGPAPYNDQIQGLWRLEESAPLAADSYFLNVMYATPAATPAMPPAQIYQETASRVRVAINRGQYVVYFDKTGAVNWGFDALDPLVISTASLPDSAVEQAYSQTLAASGGFGPYTWSISAGALPTGLSLNAATGIVSGTCTAAGTFDFTVQAEDSAFTPATTTKAFQIVVSASDLDIVTAALPDGMAGIAYSTTLAASGGTAPYTWGVSAGTLPDGLSLDSGTGVISGTPTTAATSNFTIQVTDSFGVPQTATQGFSIVIQPAGLLITTNSLPNGQVGAAYSQTVSATGGVLPYTWSVSAGSLPAGLSLDPATGVISGTPTAYGTSNFTVHVADSDTPASTDTQALSITITPETLQITTTTLPGGKEGVAYSQTVASTGGQAPIAWSVSAGSLPAGLSLAAATGVIGGTPTTYGTSNFTVQASDSWTPANADTQALSITVAPADLVITTVTLAAGADGQAYSGPLAATGGMPPYTWFVARVDLPKGLTLNVATGEMTGRPFESGTFNVTFQANDSQGFPATAQKAFDIVIAAADSDGDGLPDGWEYEHFGNLIQGASGDPDGDGYINLAEYNNNTSPAIAETIAPYIAGAKWTNIGLGGGGSQYSPVIAPNDPGLMFGNCDMGGFYRSTDGGRHFKMVDGTKVNMVTSYSPDACKPVFAPNDANTIYVGRIGGIDKSTDAGVTWTKIAGQYDMWSADWPTALAADTADSNYILAGFNGYSLTAGQFLVESRDAGSTWNIVAGWSAVGVGIREIWIDPTTPPLAATIYISTGAGIYKSIDGGANWAAINAGLPGTDILDFAAGVKAGSAVLYCTVPTSLDGSNNLIGGPYKSTDGGASWQQIKNGLTQEQWGAAVYYGALGLCDGNVDVVYLGSGENYGPTIYRTIDGGANWEMVLTHPAWSAMTPLTTVEMDWLDWYLDWGWGGAPYQVCVSPTNPNCVSFSESGRTFRSDNGGYHWFPCYTEESPLGSRWWQTAGIDVTNVYRYAIDPNHPERHFLANTDIGFSRSIDGGVTWKWSSTGSPWRNTFYDVAFDPEVDGRMWAAVSNHHDAPHWKVIRQDVPTLSGGIVISNDAGDTWAEIGHSGGLPNGMATSIAVDPTSTAANRRMWVTVMGHGVYETNDGGATWVARNSGLGTVDDMNCWMVRRYSNGDLYCLVTMALDSSLVAHPGGLWKSVDGGLNWTKVNVSQMIPWPVSFDIDPTDENVIYIAGFMGSSGLNNGGVWKTADGGTTWALALDKMECWGVRIDPASPNRVYAGVYGELTENGEGQFISEDAGATWTRFPGMPFTNYGAQWTFFDPADSQNIYIGTFGGGAWKTRVPHLAALVAAFAATPDSGGAPLNVSFDSSASAGAINTYMWDFGDGAFNYTANPTHSFASDGVYTVILTVYGPNGHTSVSHDVTVSTLAITTVSLPDATVGSAYTQTVTSTGGIAPLSWSVVAGALPAGLSLDPAAGVISGTATAVETASFTVQAQDSAAAQQTVTQALSINTSASALVITTAALPNGEIGVAYSQPLTAAGGVAPYTWAVTGGALPDGLVLDGATGIISGVPTTLQTANFTVEVTDSSAIPLTANRGLSITILPPALIITTATLPDGTVGTAYSEPVQATGGVTPYTWAVTGGALPAGLSLQIATGVISGTPTTPGTSNFTVEVTDSFTPAAVDTQALSITVVPADLVITTATLPNGKMSTAYSQALAASGGVTPYTWSISAGSLPAGLALNPATGVISGTPTAYGTSHFTVQAVDSYTPQDSDARALSIIVDPEDVVITTTTLPNGLTGSPYNETLTATGGISPYTWSIIAGSLPPVLALDPATGVINGTCTTAGTYSFTVQAADSQGVPYTDTQDLTIIVGTGADTDGDGLPDAWEITYFGDLDETGYGDYDDDGWYNITEFQRATNPTVQDLGIPDLALIKAHPRLWMRSDTSNPFVPSQALLSARTTAGYVTEWNNAKSSTALWNVALTYMFTHDAVKLTTVKTALATTTTNADTLVERALAYDWVYSGLTAGERNTYAANLVTSGYNVRGGTVPTGNMYSSTRITAERAAAMAALAAAGNDGRAQELFNRAYAAMKKFRDVTGDGFDMTNPAERPGRSGYGGGWAEGYNFDRRASRAALQFEEALRSALEQDFMHNSSYWRDKVYWLVYGTTPDAGHLLPWDANDSVYLHRFDREEMMMLASDLGNGHAQYWLNHINSAPIPYSACVEFIFKSTTLPETAFSALPGARSFEGIGLGISRSGWGTADTLVTFKASDWYSTYQDNAAGSFMIYRTAPLAVKTGVFDGMVNDHYMNYVMRTVAGNGLTVKRPGELFFGPGGGTLAPNDGGQMVQQWSTDPVSVEDWRLQADRTGTAPNGIDWPDRDVATPITVASTATYGYAAAEFSRAYAAGKVTFASRQVLHVKPDWIIVFDRVSAADPAYEKKFLVHSGENLTINGDQAVTNVTSLPGTTAAGRLFMQNMLTTGSTLTAVGGTGNEFFYDGANHPYATAPYGDQIAGKWRLEESKPVEADSYFLNVFYATTATTANMPDVTLVSETANTVTIAVDSGQTLVTFNKTGAVDYSVATGLPVTITTTTLPAGVQDAAYTAAIETNGGTVPFAWSITAGSLPAGLSLNPVSGVISGTPTAIGVSNFTVQVVDSAGTPTSDTQDLSIAVSGVNHAPTLAGLPDVATDEDMPLSNAIDLWAYASDAETPVSALTFIITTVSNPQAGVTIAANRHINLNPAANWNGTANVTVQVSDGLLTATDQFVVTINGVNDAPVFAALPNVAASEDTPLPQAINLWAYASDLETASSSLVYSIVSVSAPQAGVTIASNRYVSVNPAANWSGAATVVVQVSDGLASTTDTFDVVVSAVNDAPRLVAVPDISTQEDTPLVHGIDLWLYANDVETPADSLTYTILSSSNPQAGVSIDVNRYINVTPAPAWNGFSDVTVRVSDGSLTGTDVFRVTVQNINQPPVITHTPVATANEWSDVVITASVTDPDSTPSVTLYYRKGGAGAYTPVVMVKGAGNDYSATIPGATVRPPSVQYYISATDGISTVTSGPHTITVVALPDNTAPVVSGLATIPTRIVEGVDMTLSLSALADDNATGRSNITAAECWRGADPGQGNGWPMSPADGALDNVTEALSAAIDTSAWTVAASPYVIYVRACDDDNNWSAPVSISIDVIADPYPPAAVNDLSVAVPPVTQYQTLAATVADVSSEVPPSYAASMAVDGDTGTFWSTLGTAASQQEYMTVDLGGHYTLGRITLYPGAVLGLFPSYFKVKVSDSDVLDSSTVWKTVVTEYGYAAAPGANAWQIAGTKARYIRFEAQESVLDGGTGLYFVQLGEIEAEEVLDDSNSLLLTWTAPGDDGFVGTASYYDIRYSTSTITEANFNSAASVPGEPAPQPAGSVEGYEIKGLTGNTRYFIALKTADEIFNWSTISNVVSARTAPRPVEGIALLAPADESEMPVSAIPTFSWESTLFNNFKIELSNTPTFPSTTITLPDGTQLYTLSYTVGINKFSWKPTATQWRTVKKMATFTGGTLYWRIRGTSTTNPALGVLYSQTWHTYRMEGGHIRLAAPVDGFIAPVTPATAFTWTYDGTDMAKYYVQFSTRPDFLNDPATYKQLPSTGVAVLSYTPVLRDWKAIKILAARNGGLMYWRVKGVDASGAFALWSDTRTFTISGGTVSLNQPVPNGDGTVPKTTVSPQMSWSYAGSGFTKFYVQFSILPNLPIPKRYVTTAFLPTAGVTVNNVTLTTTQWRKVTELNATTGETVYWRVKAVDADGAFYTYSPVGSFIWQ